MELSPESFRRRFHSWRPAPALVARLASLGSGTVWFVAAPLADPDWLIAEARYIPIGGEAAELALTVRDGYQGAGMGHLPLIVSRIPATDPDCAAVLAAHRRRWPRRLAQ